MRNLFLSFFFIFLFLILSFSLVSAAPPFQTVASSGDNIQILGAVDTSYSANTTLMFPYHVFNSSHGQLLTNTTTTCSFHLINSTGEHIFVQNYNIPYFPTEFEFQATVLAGNYTPGQTYTNVFTCNATDISGASQLSYTISNGISLDSVLNNPLFIILTLVGLLFLFLGVYLHVSALGFMGGVIFTLDGMFVLINGFNNIQNTYSQATGVIFILFGLMILLLAAYDFLSESGIFGKKEGEEEY